MDAAASGQRGSRVGVDSSARLLVTRDPTKPLCEGYVYESVIDAEVDDIDNGSDKTKEVSM